MTFQITTSQSDRPADCKFQASFTGFDFEGLATHLASGAMLRNPQVTIFPGMNVAFMPFNNDLLDADCPFTDPLAIQFSRVGRLLHMACSDGEQWMTTYFAERRKRGESSPIEYESFASRYTIRGWRPTWQSTQAGGQTITDSAPMNGLLDTFISGETDRMFATRFSKSPFHQLAWSEDAGTLRRYIEWMTTDDWADAAGIRGTGANIVERMINNIVWLRPRPVFGTQPFPGFDYHFESGGRELQAAVLPDSSDYTTGVESKFLSNGRLRLSDFEPLFARHRIGISDLVDALQYLRLDTRSSRLSMLGSNRILLTSTMLRNIAALQGTTDPFTLQSVQRIAKSMRLAIYLYEKSMSEVSRVYWAYCWLWDNPLFTRPAELLLGPTIFAECMDLVKQAASKIRLNELDAEEIANYGPASTCPDYSSAHFNIPKDLLEDFVKPNEQAARYIEELRGQSVRSLKAEQMMIGKVLKAATRFPYIIPMLRVASVSSVIVALDEYLGLHNTEFLEGTHVPIGIVAGSRVPIPFSDPAHPALATAEGYDRPFSSITELASTYEIERPQNYIPGPGEKAEYDESWNMRAMLGWGIPPGSPLALTQIDLLFSPTRVETIYTKIRPSRFYDKIMTSPTGGIGRSFWPFREMDSSTPEVYLTLTQLAIALNVSEYDLDATITAELSNPITITDGLRNERRVDGWQFCFESVESYQEWKNNPWPIGRDRGLDTGVCSTLESSLTIVSDLDDEKVDAIAKANEPDARFKVYLTSSQWNMFDDCIPGNWTEDFKSNVDPDYLTWVMRHDYIVGLYPNGAQAVPADMEVHVKFTFDDVAALVDNAIDRLKLEGM